MASPLLRSNVVSGIETSNTTTTTITLPSNIVSGDLLLVCMSLDGSNTVVRDDSSEGTWTTQLDTANGSANQLVVFAKVADGTEDGGTIAPTHESQKTAWWAACYRSWEGTIAAGLDVATAATGSDTAPNPPVSADAFGAVDRSTIAVFGCNDDNAVTVYPYGDDNVTAVTSTGGGTCIGVARRTGNEDVQNPGTFTIDASDAWVATTISIVGADLTVFQSQIPGGQYINLTGSFQAQIPGGMFVNETTVVVPPVGGFEPQWARSRSSILGQGFR